MRTVSLFIALSVSLCSGLQPGLQYHYRYSARLATGIEDISHQFSAAGIQADVEVQVAEDHTVIFQFSHVEVGDFHDELHCNLREPLQIDYHRMEYGIELMEKPFKVKLDQNKKPFFFEFLEVPVEPVWITNIRKSVVNIFRLTPFGMLQSSTSEPRPDVITQLNFGQKEETMVGYCTNWYSIYMFPEVDASIFDSEHEIEDDVQREASESGSLTGAKGRKGTAKGTKKTSKTRGKTSKTSKGRYTATGPSMSDTLWNVKRSTDFENCDYLVNINNNISPQDMKRLHRSSIGTYIIRGDANGMRIEKAFIEGEITVRTKDFSEHYDTFTNQTLELKVVRPIDEPITIDYEPFHCSSWRYEIEHSIADHHVEGTQPSLEEILTGVELTRDVRQSVMQMVIKLIEDVSHRMPWNPSQPQTLTDDFHHIVEALTILHSEEIEEIYNKFFAEKTSDFDRKLTIYLQALISAATEPSIEKLLTLIPQSDFQSYYSGIVSSFFTMLSKNVVSPTLIPKIMNVVIGMEMSDRSEKSIALISFSNLISRMCFGDNARTFYWETTCEKEHICDVAPVYEQYIPYLQRGIEDTESPIWHRFIYLQALINSRYPNMLNILRPYIWGEKFYNTYFRFQTIMGLSSPFLPPTAQGEVMQLMMPIFENIQESHDIRSMAFLVMASWQRNPSWWSRMALATWNDPSSKVANLISTMIKTASQMEGGGDLKKVTAQVAYMIKPAPPAAISQSTIYYTFEMLYHSKYNKPVTFAWLASSESILPERIAVRLSGTVLFGFPSEFLVEATNLHFGKEIYYKLLELSRPASSKVSQDAIDIVTGMYEELKEKIGFEPLAKPDNVFIFNMLWEYMYIFAVEDRFFLGPVPFHIRTPYYTRIRHATIALPTDVGLPYIAEHSYEYAWWLEVTSHPSGTLRKNMAEITFDASMNYQVEVKSLVPWSSKFAVGTKVKTSSSFVWPFNMNFNMNPSLKELQVSIEPTTGDKVPLLSTENIPYTVQYGSFPTIAELHPNEYKVLHKLHSTDCLYHEKYQVLPSVAGLSVEMEYKGDIRNPFNFWNLFRGEYFQSGYTLHRWETHLVFDPEASSTKSITFTLNYVSTDKKSGGLGVDGEQSSGGQEYADYTQFSQSSSGFDYSQFSQSSSSDAQEFGGDADVFQQHSATRARIAKLQQEVVPATGGHVRSVSIDFDLQGSPNQKYAFLLTWATGVSSSKHNTKVQFTWIKDVPEGTLGEPHSTCLNFKVAKPYFEPLSSAEDVLRTEFHSTFSVDLHDGVNCDQPPIMDIEGTMDISPHQLDEARKKLSSGDCMNSEWQAIDFITNPLYDQINIKAHWTPELSVSTKNWTYFAYDMIRGRYFPDIHYDYTVHNSGSEVIIDAHKCLETQEWHIHTTKEHEVSILENFKAPYFVDVLTSPAPARQTLQFDFIKGRKPHACVITHEKVHTFDGFEYPYTPEECWHVVAMDAYELMTGTLEVRFHDGQWEARWLSPKEGLMVEITTTSVKVNGEDYKDDGNFDITFTSDGVMIQISILTGSIFKMTNEAIYLIEDDFFRSMTAGLCGNFDGEKSYDLVGPKGCIYTDPELFAKAWATPGEGCSGFSYLGKRRPVEDYQEACPTVTHPPTGLTYPEAVSESCTLWTKIEKIEGNRKCTSVTYVPNCMAGCVPAQQRMVPVTYDCEFTADTSDCAPKCYLQTMPTLVQPYCVRQ